MQSSRELKSLPTEVTNLDITRKGYVRNESEYRGEIQVALRRLLKKKSDLQKSRRSQSKERSLKRQTDRVVSTYEITPIQMDIIDHKTERSVELTQKEISVLKKFDIERAFARNKEMARARRQLAKRKGAVSESQVVPGSENSDSKEFSELDRLYIRNVVRSFTWTVVFPDELKHVISEYESSWTDSAVPDEDEGPNIDIELLYGLYRSDPVNMDDFPKSIRRFYSEVLGHMFESPDYKRITNWLGCDFYLVYMCAYLGIDPGYLLTNLRETRAHTTYHIIKQLLAQKTLTIVPFEEEMEQDTISSVMDFFTEIKEYIFGVCRSVSKSVSDALDKLADSPMWLGVLDIVVTVLAGIRLLMKTKDVESVCEILYLVFSNLCKHVGSMDFVKKSIASLGQCFKTAFSESMFDNIKNITTFFNKVLSCKIVLNIKSLVLSIVGMRFFSKDFARSLSTVLGKSTSCSVLDLVGSLFKCISDVFSVGELIVKGAPLSEALFATDPLGMCLLNLQSCLKYQDNFYIGVKVENKRDAFELVTELKTHVATLEAFIEKDKSMTNPRSIEMHDTLAKSRSFLLGLTNLIDGSSRDVPFGFIVFGAPRVGKSTVTRLVHTLNATVRGREFSPNEVYTRTKTSNYWENYDPYAHPVIHYPEGGNLNSKIVGMKGDETVAELTALIDNARFPCDMAELTLKGKINAIPQVVGTDSNSVELNLREATNNPTAGWARMLRIEVKVDPNYRVGLSALDSKKVLQDLGPEYMLSGNTFRVSRIIPKTNTDFDEEVYMDHNTPDAPFVLVEVLSTLMRKHIEHNRKIADAIRKVGTFKSYSKEEFIRKLVQEAQPQSIESVDALVHAYSHFAQDLSWKPHEWRTNILKHMKVTSKCRNPKWLHTLRRASDEDLKGNSTLAFYSMYWQYIHGQKWSERAKVKAMISSTDDDVDYDTSLIQSESFVEATNTVMGIYRFWVTLRSYFNFFLELDRRMPECIRFAKHSAMWSIIILLIWFLSLVTFWTFPLISIASISSAYCCIISFSGWITGATMKQDNPYSEISPGVPVVAHSVEGTKHLHVKTSAHYGNAIISGTTHFALIAIVCGGIYKAVSAIRKKTVKSEVCTSFKLDSPSNEILNKVEEEINADDSYVRISNKQLEKWNNKQIVYKSPPYTNKPESLIKLISHNVKNIEYVWTKDGVPGLGRTHITGVCANLALMNLHVFRSASNIILKVPGTDDLTGPTRNTLVHYEGSDTQTICKISDDVCLVKLDKPQFKDIVKHFAEDIFKSSASSFIEEQSTVVKYNGAMTIDATLPNQAYSVRHSLMYEMRNHSVGKCGKPLAVQFGSRSGIVGIHTGGMGIHGFSASVTRSDINKGISYFNKVDTFVVMSQADLSFTPAPPLPKSMLHHIDLRNLEYYGRDPSTRAEVNQKSRVEMTKLSGKVRPLMEEFGLKTVKEFKPPLMQPQGSGPTYINPMNNGVSKMAKTTAAIDHELLRVVEDMLFNKISSNLKKKGINTLKPWTMKTAINGALEDAYARRMNMSTAAGPGFPGKKGDYFPIISEDGEIIREPVEKVKELVANKVKEIMEGSSTGMQCKVALKDEPREKEKVDAGKTRLFYVADLANYTLARMLLGPFYSLFVEHSSAFYCAVGIDMHTEAAKVSKKLKSFSSNIMEGDYGGFDLRMPFAFKKCSANIIVRLLKEFGYNDTALKLAGGILSDGLYPFINVYGDILKAAGLQPSGKYATAEDNCLVNLVMIVYAWLIVMIRNGKNWDFFEYNLPITYGDDLLNAVLDSAKHLFDNIIYERIVREIYLMEFTPASKSGKLSPFVTPDTMSFLKRNFKWSEDYQREIAPIDPESIARSMMWTIPSNEILPEDQMIATCTSALKELTFHVPRKDMEKLRDKVMDMISTSYDVSREYVDENTRTVSEMYDVRSESQVCSPSSIYGDDYLGGKEEEWLMYYSACLRRDRDNDVVCNQCISRPKTHLTVSYDVFSNSWYNDALQRMIDTIDSFEMELKEADDMLSQMSSPYPNSDWWFVQATPEYASDQEYRSRCDEYFMVEEKVKGLQISIERLKLAQKRMFRNVQSESEIDAGVSVEKTMQNVEILDPEEAGVDESFHKSLDLAIRANTDLDSFFERPVQILAVPMTLSADVNISYDIANTYLKAPSVRAKLKNYAFLRGTFHVRIVTSATPFHMGALAVNVLPFVNKNDMALRQLGFVVGVKRILSVLYLSSTKGARLLDFKSNKPIEFSIPWCAPAPMGRLFNTTAALLTNGTDLEDFSNYLTLYAYSAVQPASVSATSSSPYFYAYVWMSDVKLAGLTGTQVSITSESDERKTGPIEKFSTAMLDIANAISNIPILRPYAMASKFPLSVAKDVSAAYGFSEPTMMSKPVLMKPEPYQNTCNTIGYDMSKTITTDPLCETTIDPRIVGSEEDEMVINSISKIPGIVTISNWDTSSPTFTPIAQLAVNPRVVYKYLTTSFQMNPLCFSATPFYNWRGTICYHFRIICSAYHRGKLGVWYEPNINQYALISTALGLNKQSMVLIDLQETTEIDICVAWNNSRMMLRVNNSANMKDGLLLTAPTNHNGYANGVIMVAPVTGLQSPISTVGAKVLISSSSDDIEYNLLNETLIPTTMAYSESWEAAPVKKIILGEDVLTRSDLTKLHFGESHVSYRELIKRFVHTGATGGATTGGTAGQVSTISAPYPILPYLYPNVSGGNNFAAITPSLLGWLRTGFLGYRGSLRKRPRFTQLGGASFITQGLGAVSLNYPATSHPSYSVSYATGIDGCYTVGTALYGLNTNCGVEAKLPFYNINLYGWCGTENYEFLSPSGVVSIMDPAAVTDYTYVVEVVGTFTKITSSEDTAAGDDFTLLHWMGPPGFSG
nr:MAG: polyprotein [Picornaviridae sp.]